MLESSVLENSGGGSASAQAADGGGVGGEEVEERIVSGEDKHSSGNRWPHEETLALLKIRSQMDLAFRDSNLKGPLWDEISRKMGELGYNRSAKKCREKFENIYKYHKRTKDGRSGRQNGKNYRFFEQLEVFESQSSPPMPVPMPMPMSMVKPSTSAFQEFRMDPCRNRGFSPDFVSTSTSSGSSSDDDRVMKKRKMVGYFERLMKEVLEKQEALQNKFLEAMEKCEKERMAREEAWKMQEMARIKKEQEALAHEREMCAAKDAAVLAFLQKISDQTFQVQLPMDLSQVSQKQHTEERENSSVKTVGSQENVAQQENDKQESMLEKHFDRQDFDSTGENSSHMSSSRWPKAEVEALIQLRMNFDVQCQDIGSKGSLWEDISAGMKKLGYDRNAKRCKEKWENINKYYRRVKESQKKRPEDSKTCPYFHSLDSIYQNKSKKQVPRTENPGSNIKAGELLMQMINQQQQLQQQQQSEK